VVVFKKEFDGIEIVFIDGDMKHSDGKGDGKGDGREMKDCDERREKNYDRLNNIFMSPCVSGKRSPM